MTAWNRRRASIFAVSVCVFNGAIFWVVSWGSSATVSIPRLHLELNTAFVLPIYASLLPALYCLFVYPESRAALKTIRASFWAYSAAIILGLIPFARYWVPGNPSFPRGVEAVSRFMVQFVFHLPMVALWDETIWRGCFLRRVKSFTSPSGGILLMSVAYTFWLGGLLMLSLRQGTPPKLVAMLPLIYFCMGIMLGSLFEISDGSIWPCVLLNAEFSASASSYYTSPVPVNELGTYVSELVLLIIAASILFCLATRRNRESAHVPVELIA